MESVVYTPCAIIRVSNIRPNSVQIERLDQIGEKLDYAFWSFGFMPVFFPKRIALSTSIEH